MAALNFLADRFPVVTMIASGSWDERLGSWLVQLWEKLTAWASQPCWYHWISTSPKERCLTIPTTREDVVWAASAWLITFCLVCIIVLGLGFGPAGVVAGRLLSFKHQFIFYKQASVGGDT